MPVRFDGVVFVVDQPFLSMRHLQLRLEPQEESFQESFAEAVAKALILGLAYYAPRFHLRPGVAKQTLLANACACYMHGTRMMTCHQPAIATVLVGWPEEWFCVQHVVLA